MDDTNNQTTSTYATSREEGLWPEPAEDFVMTPYLKEISDRAFAYLEAGYPVHLSGPAGTGKSTLAFYIASRLGRPIVLLHGNSEFGSSDLVGSDSGYRRKRVVDNFIHSVLKTEDEMHTMWTDSRLTTACRVGSTLIYDEFTRSRPEANNVLLSILEERILTVGRKRRADDDLLDVHPNFRAIFTSNPDEYAGVHRMQDALTDRLITIRVDYADHETEAAVTQAKSGVSRRDAESVVTVVRALRSRRPPASRPSLRASVMIAKVLVCRRAQARTEDPIFIATCRDVLGVENLDEALRCLAQ